jgi:chromosomal replication initiation ATPase DnaA
MNIEYQLMINARNEAQKISNTCFEGRYLIHIIDTRPVFKGEFELFSDSIILLTCRFLRLDKCFFTGKCRLREYVDARSMYCAYMRETYENNMPLVAIGKTINRHHATVMNAIKVHNNLIKTDPNYQKQYAEYTAVLDQKPRN